MGEAQPGTTQLWPPTRTSTDRFVDSRHRPIAPMWPSTGRLAPHRHDGYVAAAGFVPRRDVAGPLVVAAAVFCDELEAEPPTSLPSSRSLPSILALIWAASVWLTVPKTGKRSPDPRRPVEAASLAPPSQIGICRFGRGKIPALSIRWSKSRSRPQALPTTCGSGRSAAPADCPAGENAATFEAVVFDPVPADPDAEAKPAVREQVDIRGLFGEERRLPLRQDDHAGDQFEVLGDTGEIGVGDQRLVERVGSL